MKKKMQFMEQKYLFAIHASNKEILSRIYKEFLKIWKKRQTTNRKMGKDKQVLQKKMANPNDQ